MCHLKTQFPDDELFCKAEVSMQEKSILRFWEVDRFFKCPLVGMCLTYVEQKRVLKKAKLPIKKKTPFEVHEMLVASAENSNPISTRVDRMLHRKYARPATEFLHCSDRQFMPYFKAAMAEGNPAHVVWAAAVNPNLSSGCRRGIFGDIHMLMHSGAEQFLSLSCRSSRQQAEIRRLQKRNRETARYCRSLEKTIKDHEKNQQHRSPDKEGIMGRKSADRVEAGEVSPNPPEENVNKPLDVLLEKYRQAQARISTLENNNRKLSAQLAQVREMNNRFREDYQVVIQEMAALNRCDSSCPAFDLCQKRVLIVGGITKMEALYRELIEANGGIFEYHDGYMKKGSRRLESRMRRADMVLCPVNCNSHAACSAVKNLAKKHRKTVHMLDNSSLSAISRAIRNPSASLVAMN